MVAKRKGERPGPAAPLFFCPAPRPGLQSPVLFGPEMSPRDRLRKLFDHRQAVAVEGSGQGHIVGNMVRAQYRSLAVDMLEEDLLLLEDLKRRKRLKPPGQIIAGQLGARVHRQGQQAEVLRAGGR